MEDGRGQIIKEQTPAVVVAVVLFTSSLLLLILMMSYYKKIEKDLSKINGKNFNEKESLILSNKEKDQKILKLAFDTNRIAILSRRLDSLKTEKDSAVAHAQYWKARHSLIKAVLRRERKGKMDTNKAVLIQ